MGNRRVVQFAFLFLTIFLSLVFLISSDSHSALRWLVVIDAGHGGHDPGAMGYNGISEKSVNLEIARMIRIISLSDPQIEVVLTRYDDEYIPLRERINIAERIGADAYVSIHANAHTTNQPTGIETVVHETRTANYLGSLRLAERVQNSLIEELQSTGARDRGVKQRALYTRWASMPAIIVETGFVTNPYDLANLTSFWYQLRIAGSVLTGIKSYLASQ